MFFSVFMQSDSALTVVKNAEGRERGGTDEEAEVTDDEGDLEVVQPTEDWQTLKPGNVLQGVLLLVIVKHTSVLDLLCVCRPGSASRFPCEAESADGSKGGQTGRRAA